MTTKADIYIYLVKGGFNKPKRIKIKKLIKILNQSTWGFSNSFFINEKEASEFVKKNNKTIKQKVKAESYAK